MVKPPQNSGIFHVIFSGPLFLSPWIRRFSNVKRWSQWPSGLRRGFAADRLLRLRVRILPGAWTSACCECLSGRGLCDGPITRPEEYYRQWCVFICDLEASWRRWPCPALRGRGVEGVRNVKPSLIEREHCLAWSHMSSVFTLIVTDVSTNIMWVSKPHPHYCLW